MPIQLVLTIREIVKPYPAAIRVKLQSLVGFFKGLPFGLKSGKNIVNGLKKWKSLLVLAIGDLTNGPPLAGSVRSFNSCSYLIRDRFICFFVKD